MTKEKLGYTWWTKDWRSSLNVAALDLQTRGFYRELIDECYIQKSNVLTLNSKTLCKLYGINIRTFKKLLQNLCESSLIVLRNNDTFEIEVNGVEDRLGLISRASSGGKASSRLGVENKQKKVAKHKHKHKHKLNKESNKENTAFLSHSDFLYFWNNNRKMLWSKKKLRDVQNIPSGVLKVFNECNSNYSEDDFLHVMKVMSRSGWVITNNKFSLDHLFNNSGKNFNSYLEQPIPDGEILNTNKEISDYEQYMLKRKEVQKNAEAGL